MAASICCRRKQSSVIRFVRDYVKAFNEGKLPPIKAKPVPASAVNLVGAIIGDATLLKNAKGTGKLRIERP